MTTSPFSCAQSTFAPPYVIFLFCNTRHLSALLSWKCAPLASPVRHYTYQTRLSAFKAHVPPSYGERTTLTFSFHLSLFALHTSEKAPSKNCGFLSQFGGTHRIAFQNYPLRRWHMLSVHFICWIVHSRIYYYTVRQAVKFSLYSVSAFLRFALSTLGWSCPTFLFIISNPRQYGALEFHSPFLSQLQRITI